MKLETLLLKSLFTACLLVCVLTLGSMLTAKTPVSTASVSHTPVAAAANSAG
jgi:hypothetical protein